MCIKNLNIHSILFILSLALLLASFKGSERMIVKPGEGLGSLVIGSSTKKDIKKLLGQGKIYENNSYSPFGKLLISIHYEFEELGVFFNFGSSQSIKSTDTFESIYLNDNFPYKTIDGVGIGSTRAEVESVLGKPVAFYFKKISTKENIIRHYIDYEGIRFGFQSYHFPVLDTMGYKVEYIKIFKGCCP